MARFTSQPPFPPNLQPPAAKRHSRKYGSCSTDLFILAQWNWKTGFYGAPFFLIPMGFELAERFGEDKHYNLLLKVFVLG